MDDKLRDLLGVDDAEIAKHARCLPEGEVAVPIEAPPTDPLEDDRRLGMRGWYPSARYVDRETALMRGIGRMENAAIVAAIADRHIPDQLWRHYALEANLRRLVGRKEAIGGDV